MCIRDRINTAINTEGQCKAILFYSGEFDAESAFDDIKKNYNSISFYKVNIKVSPALYEKFGN